MRRKGHVLKQQREDEFTGTFPMTSTIGRRQARQCLQCFGKKHTTSACNMLASRARSFCLLLTVLFALLPFILQSLNACATRRRVRTCICHHTHTYIYMEDAWQTSSHIELTLQRGPHYNITSNKKTSSHIESTFPPKDNNSNNNNNKNSNSNSNIELKNKTSSL